jgi:hypothetical protein
MGSDMLKNRRGFSLRGDAKEGRRKGLLILVLAMAVALILAGALYLALKAWVAPKPDQTKPSVSRYTDSSFGISFQYPSNLHIEASPQVLADGTKTLELAFFNGKMINDVAREAATLLFIQEGPSRSDLPFPRVVGEILKDPEGLIPLRPCAFTVPNAQCLDVGDQDAWVNAGNFPIDTDIFLRGRTTVLGVSHGQNDSLPFSVTRIQILKTLTFY